MISQIKTYLVAALASLVSIMGIYVPWRLMAHWCNVSTTANLNALGDGDGNFSMLGAVFVWPLFMFVLPMVVVLILRASKISRFMEKFARPCVSKIIESYLANRIPDHIEIASRILGSN